MRKKRKVRWGHLSEVDRRVHVGTATWDRYPTRLKKLTAWRNLHRLAPHKKVSRTGARMGKRPSSNMTLKQMVRTGKLYQGRI